MALYTAVLIVVTGGTTAYGVLSKTVDLTIDGKTETIRTFGKDVQDVLESKGVSVDTNDRVSPAANTTISDGDGIHVKYARPMSLSVDGVTTQKWIYETTVADALESAGVEPERGAYLSDKMKSDIPRSGLDLVVSNPKDLKIKADGETKELRTAAPTVDSVLKEAAVEVDQDDEVKPGKDALVTEDLKLKVVRIETETKDEEVPVDFKIEVREDSDMLKGEEKIIRAGEKGKTRENVTVTTADGKIRDREVHDSTVLSEPVTQIEEHGTKSLPGVWDQLAKCESGGNWQTNSGNGFYGGLQFSASTWRGVGGSGLPHQNGREEQIKRGMILQERSGWGQWPACTSKLGLR